MEKCTFSKEKGTNNKVADGWDNSKFCGQENFALRAEAFAWGFTVFA